MRAVTIKEAKAHLNELVEAAVKGEQVVLMRGPKHVAAIVPISTAELELPPRLSDAQAERLWHALRGERERGDSSTFGSMESAVDHLSKSSRKRGLPRDRRAR